jgi:hypothetical protein
MDDLKPEIKHRYNSDGALPWSAVMSLIGFRSISGFEEQLGCDWLAARAVLGLRTNGKVRYPTIKTLSKGAEAILTNYNKHKYSLDKHELNLVRSWLKHWVELNIETAKTRVKCSKDNKVKMIPAQKRLEEVEQIFSNWNLDESL